MSFHKLITQQTAREVASGTRASYPDIQSSAATEIADIFAAADLDATGQNPLFRESAGGNRRDSMQHGLEAFS